ncbi:hypothetical protein [Leptospira interrogans]|uniref:hypothetical protein n=1 Tax=Leptospira interrogans TaxID=173 RepID=UPI00046C8A8E|nr:hypothetical protein [Leptospira interrogans]
MAGLNSYKFKSRIILSDSSTLVCYKFDDLLAQLEIQNAKLLDLVTIELNLEDTSFILKFMLNEGCEIFASHSDEKKLHEEIHYIYRRLQKFNNEINSFINLIIHNPFLRSTIEIIYFFLIAWFFISFLQYLYATFLSINITKEFIPKGNTYYFEVEKAILSESIELKLNVLLKGQLRDFINRDDVIEKFKSNLWYSIPGVIILNFFIYLRKYYIYLYPNSFYAFGTNVKLWNRLLISRNILNIAIVIGFLVSFGSGLLTVLIFQ